MKSRSAASPSGNLVNLLVEMVMDSNNLPFKVEQDAEAKSFLEGFRGAWFRCKIKGISNRRGQMGHSLEYFDFPDEKVTWTKLYQKPEHAKVNNECKLELMVRPSFPPFYRESQLPDSYPLSDVIAIVDDDWQVGDLIDGSSHGCYWSGKVTQLLENDKVQIQLPKPPIGEGGEPFEVLSKDARPSLNWSPEHGWTVPISREFGNSQYCVRLVQPIRQDEEISCSALPDDSVTERNHKSVESSDMPINLKSDAFISDGEVKEPSGVRMKMPSRLDRYSSVNIREKGQAYGSKYMPPVRRADTVDSAVMELEELSLKIRWLKGLWQFGFQWSNLMKPSWKLIKHYGSPKQR